MAHTDKDHPDFRRKHWQSIRQPSWWNKMLRDHHRERARQDLRNGREPLPKYRGDDEYYW